MKPKILDCTLRDGGYYTNWDFSSGVVKNYILAMENLPIDYIEIGYRNSSKDKYYGEFFYCPIFTIDYINQLTKTPLAIIIDERNVGIDDIQTLLSSCIDKIRMIRMAVDPKNISSAIQKAQVINKMGFEVAFNIMYLSEWVKDYKFLDQIIGIENYVDYFYMVDSYGAVYPNQLKPLIFEIKKRTKVKLGFHGHNNLELAHANSLIALEEGVDIIDSTILGMGRGSGNLKTELFLSTLSKKFSLNINFNSLSKVLEDFQNLKEDFQWGTNLPYMLAGIHSIPQKQIMEWLGKRFYSFNSIVSALNSKILKRETTPFKILSKKREYKKGLIIGGGYSITEHALAIKHFIKNHKDLILIFSSSRHLAYFNKVNNHQYICLVGNENERLSGFSKELNNTNFVIPPSPREIGTFIPKGFNELTFELDQIGFTNKKIASHCSVSLQTVITLGLESVYIVGFDGYINQNKGSKEREVFNENEIIFHDAQKSGLQITSLTPTLYSNIDTQSIYSIIK
jgi:4-hydroxy 2-oxovalerate aldolase